MMYLQLLFEVEEYKWRKLFWAGKFLRWLWSDMKQRKRALPL